MHRSRQRRLQLFVAFGLAAMLLAVGCGGDDSSSPTTAPPSGDGPGAAVDASVSEELDLSGVRLRVGVVASTSGFRQAIYDESGVYDDVPYRIEWSEFESAATAVEALNAGAIDMTVTQQSTVVVLGQGNAARPWTAETAPYVVVGAEVTISDPGFNLLVRPDSGIESVADLAGKKVAYAPGALGHYFIIRLALDAGLGSDDLEHVQLPAGEARAAFNSGAVDALVTGYRNALPLIASGEATVLATASDTIAAYSLSLVRAGVLDDPGMEFAVGDVLERVEASQQWSLANLDIVTHIHETVGNMDPDDARIAAEAGPKRRVPIDASVIAALQDQADVFLAEGIIANRIDVSVMFDDRYNASVPRG
jgi:sulfonate transport system substrate-binding protein